MLAAIISLLQDDQPQPRPTPSVKKHDMGGGWGLYDRSFEITDYVTAMQAFPQKDGESPFDTTVRRQAYMGQALLVAKAFREERESKAMAIGMLWGAKFERDAAAQLKVDAARAVAVAPAPAAMPLALAIATYDHGTGGELGTAVKVMLGIGIAAAAFAFVRSRF